VAPRGAAVASVKLGQHDRANCILQQLLEVEPELTVSSIEYRFLRQG
jgi:hypothetical protein